MGFIIYIIVALLCGFITMGMNKSKGYSGGFAWGFFLSIIGIIVVAVRPYAKEEKKEDEKASKDEFIAYCTECKNVFGSAGTNPQNCPKCNSDKTVSTGITVNKWESMNESDKFNKKTEWFGVTLDSLFEDNGLEKYIPTLKQNDAMSVDVLPTLTETDLINIGIESLGDRKRLLSLFHDLAK